MAGSENKQVNETFTSEKHLSWYANIGGISKQGNKLLQILLLPFLFSFIGFAISFTIIWRLYVFFITSE